ncbi:hypothetical protein FRC03_005720 [Tulasnella sp. 419]|nr:hypothetical protein FRC03_005720 [Tulasnella sp. 419]
MTLRLAIQRSTSTSICARGPIFWLPFVRNSHQVAPASKWPVSFLRPEIRDAESAIKLHDRCVRKPQNLLLFCDGSKLLKGVGAACVDLAGKHSRSLHVGPYNKHSALEAELEAIKLGLEIIREAPEERHSKILTDCSRAISLISGNEESKLSPRETVLLEAIRALLRSLRRQARFGIGLYWIPGHKRLEGNESAHKAAQKAAVPMVTGKSKK